MHLSDVSTSKIVSISEALSISPTWVLILVICMFATFSIASYATRQRRAYKNLSENVRRKIERNRYQKW